MSIGVLIFLSIAAAIFIVKVNKVDKPPINESHVKEAIYYPKTYDVNINNVDFVPPELEVVVGDSVVFTSIDKTNSHNIYIPNLNITSKRISYDSNFTYTFMTEGEFNYTCNLHPFKKGKIIVKPLKN